MLAEVTSSSTAWHVKYRRILICADLAAVTIAVMVATLLRFDFNASLGGMPQITYLWLTPIFVICWMVMLSLCRTRARELIGSGVMEYRRVMVASLWVFGLAALVSYLLEAQLSRAFFILALPTGILLLLVERWMARKWLAAQHQKDAYLTPTLLVGRPHDLSDLALDLSSLRDAGYTVTSVSVMGEDTGNDDAWYAGLPRCRFDAVINELAKESFGAVIVAGGLDRRQLRHFAWELESAPVELMLRTSLTDVAGPRITAHTVEGLSMTHVDLPRFSGWQYAVKRFADVLFSGAVLLLLLPVFGVIAALIKLHDGGPVFFRQTRVGREGQPFTIHKFRSMSIDAEERRAELEHLNEGAGLLFKITDDPRVTGIGKILRRYSLDELPQFWDVLRGDMSVVGPRPPLPSEVAQYNAMQRRRLLIKPGITGLWQVSGRSSLSWEESIRLDLRYVENWSLLADAIIVVKTVFVAFRGRDAY
jgi:exopolysaccharide biosynthesis polyprenyl glycosylphosphotransferase